MIQIAIQEQHKSEIQWYQATIWLWFAIRKKWKSWWREKYKKEPPWGWLYQADSWHFYRLQQVLRYILLLAWSPHQRNSKGIHKNIKKKHQLAFVNKKGGSPQRIGITTNLTFSKRAAHCQKLLKCLFQIICFNFLLGLK